jgi:hypothetical protein
MSWGGLLCVSWGRLDRRVNFALPPFSIGSVIAVIVLVLAVVFMAVGQMDFKTGGMFAALAIARLT